jgi:hypothetical protein
MAHPLRQNLLNLLDRGVLQQQSLTIAPHDQNLLNLSTRLLSFGILLIPLAQLFRDRHPPTDNADNGGDRRQHSLPLVSAHRFPTALDFSG